MNARILIACVALAALSCVEPIPRGGTDRVWTMRELQALRGKTRGEVREEMGRATGLYTIDSKGRWHYPAVLIREEGEQEPKKRIVMVYFSKFGEQRCTIVEVRERLD